MDSAPFPPLNLESIETKSTLKPNQGGPPTVTKTVTKIKQSKSTLPPLFSFQLTNPVTYLKAWWKKLVGNEGIKLTLQIKPLTAMTLTLIVSGIGFGLGRLTIPEPLIQYVPMLANPTMAPSPTPSPWRETAFSGKLQVSAAHYYLVTTSAEAITLEVPPNLNLAPLVGRRIMAVGNYNKGTRILVVSDATDLEVLPANPVPIPTLRAEPSPLGGALKTTPTPPPSGDTPSL
ncbi:hypothetical protein A2W24_06650 [Microgenomates group bacterium RBG_16_45_19]|nr:MAG: hypothetical protein A2W24_06650 [Microgenomates group bacterium RBG_16_45_19]